MMELELEGKQYKIGKLSAIQQFHLARKIAPLMLEMAKGGDPDTMFFGDMIEPVVARLSEMSTSDTNFIIDSCLSVVSRKDDAASAWVKVKEEGIPVLQYADISMIVMLRLIVLTIKENIGNFFDEVPSLSEANPQA